MADNTIQQFLIDQSTSLVTLKKTLDAQATRQKAHAQNIANAETPGYRRLAVDFEDQLESALNQTGSDALKRADPRHITSDNSATVADVNPILREEAPDPNGSGVNGVDIDKEMSQMAETQLRYLTALELLKRRYSSIKSAIKGQ